ncbi:hypothetical protein V2G26_000680 [Clonostachys chloroleuca]
MDDPGGGGPASILIPLPIRSNLPDQVARSSKKRSCFIVKPNPLVIHDARYDIELPIGAWGHLPMQPGVALASHSFVWAEADRWLQHLRDEGEDQPEVPEGEHVYQDLKWTSAMSEED